VPRVGYLSQLSGSGSEGQRGTDAFRQALRELGYVEGQSVAIEYRFAEGKAERLPDLAAELVRLKVDVIVTIAGVPPAQAAQGATRMIPIVASGTADPVAAGLVASLARPGGNITGPAIISHELVGKELQLIRKVVPNLSRVAVEARGPGEIDRAFAAMARERAGVLLVVVDSMFLDQRERIAGLAARNRLPAIYGLRRHAEAGGLMAYSANLLDLSRHMAIYVDKILKGAKPANLPVEEPTKFELVINLKTAKALGLMIPPSVLGRADEVIQ
jgi:putative ABC transport system substrate-binding protein